MPNHLKTIRVMGVINISPESFYKGSIKTGAKSLISLAQTMERDGANILDIGAMSTAPYLKTQISEQEEIRRVVKALCILKRQLHIPISIDTTRANVAKAAFNEGATILNDITGLHGDSQMPIIAKQFNQLILMAHPIALKKTKKTNPIIQTNNIFRQILNIASLHDIHEKKIILDPGIGFFRNTGMPWWKWDLGILRDLSELTKHPFPLLIGLSRKSFIGKLLDDVPAEGRLAGSLVATMWAIEKGAQIIRTHDVKETREVIKIYNYLKKDGKN
ncbi:MAG: dihydropteroate synthase [Elusimicrobiota bacterium]